MKKNILLPRITLLAIFFITSIFTRINAQIIVSDLPNYKTTPTFIIPQSQDTMFIQSNDNSQLVFVKIYDLIAADTTVLVLSQNITLKQATIVKSNTKQNKKALKQGQNLPLDENRLRTIGKVYIKDLLCNSGRKYLVDVTFIDSNNNIDTCHFYIKRCNTIYVPVHKNNDSNHKKN